MEKLSFYLALWGAKAAGTALRWFRRDGSGAPGRLALSLCPEFLSSVGRPETLVCVTGSCGRSGAGRIARELLENLDPDTLSNDRAGDGKAGVAAALASAASLSGKCRKKLGILVLEESCAAALLPLLKPEHLLITDLFRGSMEGMPHPEYIAGELEKCIPPETALVLNADDPFVFSVAPLNRRTLYAVDALPQDLPLWDHLVQDLRLCPVCGEPVSYEHRRFHHLGRVSCPACGWHSPDPDTQLISADEEAGRMTVMETEVWQEYRLLSPEVPKLCDSLAAVTLLRSMGYAPAEIARAMESCTPEEAPLPEEEVGERRLIPVLLIGPTAAACSRRFDALRNQPGKKAVVLLADGVQAEKTGSEDVSWLYDTDHELLDRPEVVQVLAVGARSLDVRLRLLLAGLTPEKVKAVRKAGDAAGELALADCGQVYLLYTPERTEQARQLRAAIAERMRRS